MAGLCHEQLEIGLTFQRDIRRTVIETDNIPFTTTAHDPADGPDVAAFQLDGRMIDIAQLRQAASVLAPHAQPASA